MKLRKTFINGNPSANRNIHHQEDCFSVEVSDMQAYETFLRERLASIPNIAQVQSSFVLRQLKG